jgi:hypothetical protein
LNLVRTGGKGAPGATPLEKVDKTVYQKATRHKRLFGLLVQLGASAPLADFAARITTVEHGSRRM